MSIQSRTAARPPILAQAGASPAPVRSSVVAPGHGVFLAGTRRYRFKKLAGSPLTQFAAVLVVGWRMRCLDLPSDPAMLYDIDVGMVAAAEQPPRPAPVRSSVFAPRPSAPVFALCLGVFLAGTRWHR
jgi:hypothetical protein